MKQLLRRFSEPPAFEDEELALRARMFHKIMWNIMRVASPLLAVIALADNRLAPRALVAITAVNVMGFPLLELNRRGRARLASTLLVSGLVLLVTGLSLIAGGIRSPGVTVYFIFVMTAGVLLGQRAALITTLVCAMLGVGLIALELTGFLPEQAVVYGPVPLWVLNTVYMTVVLGLLGLSNDALGGALRRVEAELGERRASERERERIEKQLRHSQKMEALGTLAGGVAHDFNNILAAIVANVEIGLMDLETTHPSRLSMEEIRDAAGRASDIVKHILLFSRRQESAHRIIPLTPLVAEAISLVRVSLPKNITVKTSLSADVSPISGDASQLYQVVMNVATNGAHAMAGKGGTLAVSLEAVVVSEAESAASADLEPGPYVCITVTDSGTGMSHETVERIFEPFFTTKGPSGTGLGLSVVHGIVQSHRGAITVESEPGRGTTFRIYLPAVSLPEASESDLAPGQIRGRGEHIMYVDDEEPLVRVMERALTRMGYRCTGYSDPVAALRQFKINPDAYAAVITDLVMPAMSGVELTGQMRALRPDLRVALTSGHAEGQSTAQAAGIPVRIQKPFSANTLAVAMHFLLEPVADRVSPTAVEAIASES